MCHDRVARPRAINITMINYFCRTHTIAHTRTKRHNVTAIVVRIYVILFSPFAAESVGVENVSPSKTTDVKSRSRPALPARPSRPRAPIRRSSATCCCGESSRFILARAIHAGYATLGAVRHVEAFSRVVRDRCWELSR